MRISSGALYELGVRPGHVVAIQLPNWWQALVLFQAVARLPFTVRASDSFVRRFAFNERHRSAGCVLPSSSAEFDEIAVASR